MLNSDGVWTVVTRSGPESKEIKYKDPSCDDDDIEMFVLNRVNIFFNCRAGECCKGQN